ncbi:MAG: hypothetical protein M1356_02585, partial [Gammaproteobacteria bacterium]|nr:hypothetical protein [Gammaproteobacteria bacterium]
DVACFYAYSESMLWNCGIICAPLGLLLEESKRHMPDIGNVLSFTDVDLICADDSHTPSSNRWSSSAFAERYAQLPAISIDYALLEKSDKRAVVAGSFGWSDIGSLEAFIGACRPPEQQNTLSFFDASHNSAYANKLVVFAGVTDICVVDTGDMLLVTRRDLMDRSADMAQQMLAKGYAEYL